MITDIQEKMCSKCKFHEYKMSRVSPEFDKIVCKRNKVAHKCHNGMYDDYEFI